VSEILSAAPALLSAILVGYLLGALPIADQMSRRHGVDIFSVGTKLSGASNVRRHVGNVPGALVLLGDIAKGALAIIAAWLIGVDGLWVILPAAASIIGHWKSVFTRFKGGDGLATLGGIIIALFPVSGFIAVSIGMAVSFGGQKMPYTSLLSIVFSYLVLVTLNIIFQGDLRLTLAIGALSIVVLGYASLGHLKRRQTGEDWDELDDTTEGATEQTGF